MFDYIASMARIRIQGRRVLLSHFPYPGTSEGTDENGRPYDDRYLQYRLLDLGVPLLHGHTHRNEQLTRSEKGTPQIYIGPDGWDLRPVQLGEIERLLSGV